MIWLIVVFGVLVAGLYGLPQPPRPDESGVSFIHRRYSSYTARLDILSPEQRQRIAESLGSWRLKWETLSLGEEVTREELRVLDRVYRGTGHERQIRWARKDRILSDRVKQQEFRVLKRKFWDKVATDSLDLSRLDPHELNRLVMDIEEKQ